jgi:hypothetical protein
MSSHDRWQALAQAMRLEVTRHFPDSGLGVSIAGKGNSACVVIEAGLAIDAQGEEIEAPEAISLPLPGQGKTLAVQIRFAERPCQPVPVATPDDGAQQYSRIKETYEAVLSPTAAVGAVSWHAFDMPMDAGRLSGAW